MQKPPEKPEESDSDKRRLSSRQLVSMGQLATTGAELGLTVAALTLLGWWLDTQWNSSPWMLITGAFIGTIGSLYKLWRVKERWFGKQK